MEVLFPPPCLSLSSPERSSGERRGVLWKVGSKASAMLSKWPPGSCFESLSNICDVRALVFPPLLACHISS